jgi:hypothetical protein
MTQKPTRRRVPIPIDKKNPWDKQVKELTDRGFHAKVIAERTGLTVSQVRRRQHVMKVSPLSWREGKSHTAVEVLARTDELLKGFQKLREAGYYRYVRTR